MPIVDFVTVVSNDENYHLHKLLKRGIENHVGVEHTFVMVDNRRENLGFAKGCNVGARFGHAKIIGFLNPDAQVHGAFMRKVITALADPRVVITGQRYDKPQEQLAEWGLSEWVCGACLFVQRHWFESVGGFDERFFLFWEETDLCRQAEAQGLKVCPVDIPILHASPTRNSDDEHRIKSLWMTKGRDLYFQKWKP